MIIKPQPEYELIDSGDEMKLERYGSVVLSRPDPQAIWPKKLSQKEWDQADAQFISAASSDEKGRWHTNTAGKKRDEKVLATLETGKWPITLGPIKIFARQTPFKHTGIFPEQYDNWIWAENLIKNFINKNANTKTDTKPRVLNLFGYTGGASIVCAKAGASVTHVDASKAAITWAKENMLETGLDAQAIRWMLEDVVVFVKKEIRRGAKYDAIMMDPPIFGRGAKGEVWKIGRDLMPLLELCYKLLSDTPIFFILNGYSAGYSSTAYANNLAVLEEKFGGTIEHGELLIEETGAINSAMNDTGAGKTDKKSKTKRYLPCGIVARWSK